MALPFFKLTVLVGAGVVGSIIAKEGRLPDVSGFFSGALKIAFKQLRQDQSAPSKTKPQNSSLLAQVHSLQEEVQLLVSNRHVTIVTTSSSGARRYGIIVVMVVIGYGYVWWKGWKLPDMMFATRQSLRDACDSIGKQLENVYSSISATKRHLSSRIDHVDSSLDECSEVTVATQEEVAVLRGEVDVIGVDFKNVHHAVRTLETKINRIEGKQAQTTTGVLKLVKVARSLESASEDTKATECIQAGPSKPAIELPPTTPRTLSLPPNLSSEPSSPLASNGSPKVKRPLQCAVSGSGLKDVQGIADLLEPASRDVETNGNHVKEKTDGSSSFGPFLRKFPSIGASFFTRTRTTV